MMRIKTIYDKSAEAFDREVNAALADGWKLTRRAFDIHGFVAELERHTSECGANAEKEVRGCAECRHFDICMTGTTYNECDCLFKSEWEPRE